MYFSRSSSDDECKNEWTVVLVDGNDNDGFEGLTPDDDDDDSGGGGGIGGGGDVGGCVVVGGCDDCVDDDGSDWETDLFRFSSWDVGIDSGIVESYDRFDLVRFPGIPDKSRNIK